VRRRDALFAVAAIATHVAATAVIPPRARPPARPARIEDVMIVELVPVEPASASAGVATERQSEGGAEIEGAAERAPVPARDRARVPYPVAPERDTPEREAADPAPTHDVALDPESVARAMVRRLDPDPAPSVARLRSPAGASSSAASDELALERALSADLHARGRTKLLGSPRRIELRARADGSHVYEGDGFTAVIATDGTVAYRDHPTASVDPDALPSYDSMGLVRDPRSPIPELARRQGGLMETAEPPIIPYASIGGRLDVEGEVRSALGEDPWSAERLQFLDETETLRGELEDRHAALDRASTERAALRRLTARLARIWDGAGSAEDRRRRIFEEWDGCTEEGAGLDARARVLRFVRGRLPTGSVDGYSASELRALNASRESIEPFAP
jgi:hypothetical protein